MGYSRFVEVGRVAMINYDLDMRQAVLVVRWLANANELAVAMGQARGGHRKTCHQ